MAIRVGPTEKNPTHHIKLTDVDGNSVGLILCNDAGDPAPMYVKSPVMRTALKTTSGGGSYADYNTPYSPIVQDNWSGGRANLDFERDSTRFFDSYRVTTRRENIAFMGPKEFFSKGYRSMEYTEDGRYNQWYLPDNTQQFTATSSFTIATLWVKIRSDGRPNIQCDLYDSAGTTLLVSDNFTYASNGIDDAISGKWVPFSISYAIVSGTTYTIKLTTLSDNDTFEWLAVSDTKSTTELTSPKGMYFIEPAAVEDNVIYYQYRGQQYKVISPDGGKPTVWMNGDRGTADSNAGQLSKVIDATKTWTTNQWAGCVVKIVHGTGITEPQLYRNIVSNTATELICDDDWTIAHDTTTEYVIVGSDTWKEMTGHGLTAKVTSVLSAIDQPGGVVYFAQGDSVAIRDYTGVTTAGVWTDSWRANGSNYATFLAYQPLSNKIWRAQNRDATAVCSVSSATPVAYGSDLVFGTVIQIGNNRSLINGIEVYPSDGGTEALWVFKEHLAFIVTTQAEGIKLDEMRHVRSRVNGTASMVHNVYLYFNLGNGLERYYGGNIEDLGPNLEQGLPTDRDGPIKKLMGYPGRIFALIDAGASGYSSLIERSGGGWHEVYRAPYGQRLKGMDIQVIPGDENADRLWLYQGNTSVWLTLSSNGTNELKDSAYRYTHDGYIIFSRMHAGLYDIQKIAKLIRLFSAGMVDYGSTDIVTPFLKHTFHIDYRMDDTTSWTLGTAIQYNGAGMQGLTNFGVAGKRIQLRVRFHSYDDQQTPQLQAAIVDAVTRSDVKYFYNLQFRVMDDEPTLAPREMDDNSATRAGKSAITKLTIIENWGDSATEGLLYMESNSPLYNGKYVFINPPVTRQIGMDPSVQRDWTGNAYICSTNAQEA